jgi:hypothetical protein
MALDSDRIHLPAQEFGLLFLGELLARRITI